MSLPRDNSKKVNSNQVTSVKRQTARNKISVNRLIKETKNPIDIQNNIGQPDKAKVIANREMLSTKIQLIKSYDEQILDSADPEADMERKIFESSEFEKSVSERIISINMWLNSHENEAMSDGTVPYPIQNSNLQNSNISVRPRLPRQEILPFSGDPLQFQSFWEIFDSSIHLNTSFAPINKFLILKLFSPEKQKMHNEGNCNEAVAILKSRTRFGDPQVVIQSNIDILLALHPVSSSSNTTELRKIYGKVETFSRNLQLTFADKYLETCLKGSGKFQNY